MNDQAKAKAIHWRTLEHAQLAAQHGDVGTFQVHLGEIHDGKRVLHNVEQAELLGRMSDSEWKVVHFSWHATKFRRGVMLFTVELLPSHLMHANVSANVRRYIFEVADDSALQISLGEKRATKMHKK